MKKEYNEKIIYVCYLVASICFYISAIFCFISDKTDTSTGIIQLCLGSAFLCLSATYMNKDKNNKDKK